MFDRLAARGEGAFGAFLMLGDPDLETSARLLDAVVTGGADMVEVGIPFSDPIADGPVIQAAARRALDAGVRVSDCFDLIAGFRERHPEVPVGILTYANLVIARPGFMRDAAEAGADSLLVADLPTLEAAPWVAEMRQSGIVPVLIAASNTPPKTLDTVAQLSQAYTYCVSRASMSARRSRPALRASFAARPSSTSHPAAGMSLTSWTCLSRPLSTTKRWNDSGTQRLNPRE
jgi:tryptophan synthase alpha chain